MVFASLSNLSVAMSHLAVQDVQIPTNGGDGRLMVVFMGIAAISLLVLALLAMGTLVALLVVGIKAKGTLRDTVNEVKQHAYPLIEKSAELVNDLTPVIKSVASKTDVLISELAPTIKEIAEKTNILMEEVSPKVSGITDDLHSISSSAREMAAFAELKLQEFSPAISAAKDTFMRANATVRSANDMTERQVERVDGMVTGVLNWTSQMPVKLGHGLGAPGRFFDKASKRAGAQGGAFMSIARDLWKGIFTTFGGDRRYASSSTEPFVPPQR